MCSCNNSQDNLFPFDAWLHFFESSRSQVRLVGYCLSCFSCLDSFRIIHLILALICVGVISDIEERSSILNVRSTQLHISIVLDHLTLKNLCWLQVIRSSLRITPLCASKGRWAIANLLINMSLFVFLSGLTLTVNNSGYLIVFKLSLVNCLS